MNEREHEPLHVRLNDEVEIIPSTDARNGMVLQGALAARTAKSVSSAQEKVKDVMARSISAYIKAEVGDIIGVKKVVGSGMQRNTIYSFYKRRGLELNVDFSVVLVSRYPNGALMPEQDRYFGIVKKTSKNPNRLTKRQMEAARNLNINLQVEREPT